MDQNKSNIPNLFTTPKTLQTMSRLQTHLTGVLAYTNSQGGKKVYAFYDICQWPQDMNLASHALMTVLTDFTEGFPEYSIFNWTMPVIRTKTDNFLGYVCYWLKQDIS